jgi:hypothetical protein
MKYGHELICILMIALLIPGGAFSQDPKPWENPNSGYDKSSGATPKSSSGGYDRIDTVIKTTGATKVDGKVVSTGGSDKDKSFVDGFLNEAAKTLTGANGTASAWSWKKSWTVGPDGKPTEVKETYHEGSLNKKGSSDPKPATTAPAGSSPTVSSPAPSSASSGPSGSSGPASTPGGSSPSTPSTPSTSVKTPVSTPPTSGPSAGTPSGTAATPKPTSGPIIAPPKLPPAPPSKIVTLVIEDQLTGLAQPFVSVESGFASVAVPIPEDVRTQIGLELGDGIRPQDVTVNIIDDNGDNPFPGQSFPRPYHHIFRQPSPDKYFATVVHRDPVTFKTETKLHIVIPVYKVSTRNKAIESEDGRSSGGPLSPGAGSSYSSGAPVSNFAGTNNPSSNRSFGGYSGAGADTGAVDVSDLYNDPATNSGSSVAGTAGGKTSTGSTNAGPGGTDATIGDGSSDPEISGDAGQADQTEGAGHSGNPENAGTSVAGNPSADPSQNPDEVALQEGLEFGPDGKPLKKGKKGSKKPVLVATAQIGAAGSPRTGSSGGAQTGSDGTFTPGKTGSSSKKPVSSGNPAYENQAVYNSVDTGAEPAGGVTTGSVETQMKSHLVALTLYNDGGTVQQSFDFMADAAPQAKNVELNTKLNFSLDIGKEVNRESVVIVLYDGKGKREMSLESLRTDLFDHTFASQANDAYVWIYGESSGKPFSYKVTIPVTHN